MPDLSPIVDALRKKMTVKEAKSSLLKGLVTVFIIGILGDIIGAILDIQAVENSGFFNDLWLTGLLLFPFALGVYKNKFLFGLYTFVSFLFLIMEVGITLQILGVDVGMQELLFPPLFTGVFALLNFLPLLICFAFFWIPFQGWKDFVGGASPENTTAMKSEIVEVELEVGHEEAGLQSEDLEVQKAVEKPLEQQESKHPKPQPVLNPNYKVKANQSVEKGWCPSCGESGVLITGRGYKPSAIMILVHLGLCLVTFGGWVPLWVGWAIGSHFRRGEKECMGCGVDLGSA